MSGGRRAKPLPRECSVEDGRPKVRYDTRAEAKDAARRHDVGEHAYRCGHCGYFHLASRKRRPLGPVALKPTTRMECPRG